LGEIVDNGYHADSDYLELSNEFALVRIRKVKTRDGERLEITSPKLGLTNYLDPLQLESLTWCDKQMFSRLLRQPWGPEDEHE
jgi:hypothetical protein